MTSEEESATDQHVSEWEPLSDETINREPGDPILVDPVGPDDSVWDSFRVLLGWNPPLADTGWMRDKVIAGRPISVSQADWARYLVETGDWETLRRWAEVMEDD